MTSTQRDEIRSLFGKLGIAGAREQFDLIAELTGIRLGSVAELQRADANTVIRMLSSRVANARRENTGNSWTDRDEDTWIDRL